MHPIRLEREPAKAVPALRWFFNAKNESCGSSTATVGRARYRSDQAYDVTSAVTVSVVGEMSPQGMRMQVVISGGRSGHPFSALSGSILVVAYRRQVVNAASPNEIDGPAFTRMPD
jgi:hypothetical protein